MNRSQVSSLETTASWYGEETEDRNISLEGRGLGSFAAAVCVEASVKVTGSSSKPPNMSNIENSDSPPAFQVQPQRQRRPPVSLSPWAPSEASGLRFRVGMENRTGHRGTVPRFQKVQTSSMCCGAGGASQELLLDVGAGSTTGAKETWGTFGAAGYESRNLHTHWWEVTECQGAQ